MSTKIQPRKPQGAPGATGGQFDAVRRSPATVLHDVNTAVGWAQRTLIHREMVSYVRKVFPSAAVVNFTDVGGFGSTVFEVVNVQDGAGLTLWDSSGDGSVIDPEFLERSANDLIHGWDDRFVSVTTDANDWALYQVDLSVETVGDPLAEGLSHLPGEELDDLMCAVQAASEL